MPDPWATAAAGVVIFVIGFLAGGLTMSRLTSEAIKHYLYERIRQLRGGGGG